MPVFRHQKPLAFTELLALRSDRLSQLQAQAAELAGLQRQLRQCLPHPLRDHLFVAACDDHSLVLLADGSAWAARLRYQVPRLLDYARENCGRPALRSIRIRTAPPESRARPARKQVTLSPAASKLLHQAAATTDDDGLRTLLLRLAGR